MEPANYVKGAIKTEQSDLTPVKNRLQDVGMILMAMKLLADAESHCDVVDDLKKSVFYGKNTEGLQYGLDEFNHPSHAKQRQEILDNERIMQGVNHFRKAMEDSRNVRLFHSVVGIVSESAELIKAVMSAWTEGKEIDWTNLKEEYSDLQWYTAIGLNAMNSSYEEIWKLNLEKLAKRYGKNYTDNAAINRDLVGERNTMEQSIGKVD